MTDLVHRIDGRPDGPLLVLAGSLGSDMTMWAPQVPALAERFRVVRYDTRGHGASPLPPGELTIADLGADLLGLLDHLGADRASVAGVSLGGMAAMWAASEAPERIERLVLCSTSAQLGPPAMWDERAQLARGSGIAALADGTLQRWLTPAADPELAGRLRTMFCAVPADGYAACCAAVRDMDLRPRLARIAAPTLVIAGADDPSTPPAHAERIAAGIPAARVAVVAAAAHLVNVERPEEVTTLMLEHL